MPTKRVGEIFSDYNIESNIKDAEVKALNVNKRNNSLGIILHSSNYIEIKDIWYLEKFLKDRFKFLSVDMKIEYEKEVKLKSIDKEWENIICYISHRFPIAKNMLFKKSDIQIIKDTIVIKMHMPGAEFLKAKKADVEVQKTIEGLFGKKYKIDIIENMSEDDKKQLIDIVNL